MPGGTNSTTGLLTSPIITVLAGTEKQAISVHAGALEACSSPVIKALVSEDWKEGQEKLVDWSHTDVPTALRVISYLYTRDYEVEVLEYVELGKQSQKWANDHDIAFHRTLNEAAGKSDNTATPAGSEPPSDVVPRPLTPLAKIVADNAFLSSGTTSYASLLSEVGQKLECNDIASYLQAHAKVYIFAQSHLISDLESFSLGRMGGALQFAEKKKQPEAVLGAVNLIYQNTIKPKAKEEPMRRIVSQFLVLNLRQVQNFNEFLALIEEGGDFSLDVFHNMSRGMDFAKVQVATPVQPESTRYCNYCGNTRNIVCQSCRNYFT